jgi:hypothetical protein
LAPPPLSLPGLHAGVLGRGLVPLLLAAAMVRLLLYTIVDLDRPARGLIQVPDRPLIRLRATMNRRGARLVRGIVISNKLSPATPPGCWLSPGSWAANVIASGLRYWDLERGGAAARAHQPYVNPAFAGFRAEVPDDSADPPVRDVRMGP